MKLSLHSKQRSAQRNACTNSKMMPPTNTSVIGWSLSQKASQLKLKNE